MAGTRSSAQDNVLQQVLSEFRAMNAELAALRAELKSFKENLDPIIKVIRGDGDVPSIPTQIALLNENIKTIKSDVLENKNNIKEIKDDQDAVQDEQDEQKSGRWMLWTAIITGVFGTIGTIITGILSLIK